VVQAADVFAHQGIVLQRCDQVLAVFQFAHFAAGVGEDDLLEALVGFGVADDRREGSEAGAESRSSTGACRG